jgi:carboxypeptidase PM20D1
VLEAVESGLAEALSPPTTSISLFAGDEEVIGRRTPDRRPARVRGIRPALVLDEGGAVLSGVFPNPVRRDDRGGWKKG